jgi:predicted phage terminase large subunit-like protein
MLSADNPDRIRGYNLSGVWADEMGAWRYESSWYDGLIPALRIGEYPRAFITTTPRSTKLMRDLAGRTDGSVVMLRGSTWDNRDNLSAAQLAEYEKWRGTTRGRQELEGELLEDMPGANWRRPWIDQYRINPSFDKVTGKITNLPELHRIVIGIDPSGTADDGSDECGIVAAGIARDGHMYVLDDASLVASPDGWANRAVRLYREHDADRIVAEKNFGGDMVEATLRHVDANLPIRMVTASRGKSVRAEPIAALYEQGRVHHVGAFVDLEDQMTQWEESSKDSPDRMDALVWALTELAKGDAGHAFLTAWKRRQDDDTTPTAPTAPAAAPRPSWRDRVAGATTGPPRTRPPAHV